MQYCDLRPVISCRGHTNFPKHIYKTRNSELIESMICLAFEFANLQVLILMDGL